MRHLDRLAIAALALGTACAGPPADGDGESTGTDESTGETGDTGGPDGWRVSHQAGTDQGALMSVWGSSPTDLYAVGGQPGTPDDPSVGVAVHFDGEVWTEQSLPADTAMLNWVYGTGEVRFAVGQKGSIVRREGDAWLAETSPTDRTLWGVWGASLDEVWAVGGNGASDDPVLLVRRDDAWSAEVVPDLVTDAKGLFKVWGTAADDVWVVGDRGVTLHYDGDAWTAHETGESIDLISLWGTEAEGVIAVGGRASGYLARLDGDAWSTQTLSTPGLNGVWVDPGGSITAVGTQGLILSVTPGGFDVTQEESPTPLSLHATFGFEDGPRYAVGGSLLAAPPWVGVVLVDPG